MEHILGDMFNFSNANNAIMKSYVAKISTYSVYYVMINLVVYRSINDDKPCCI